MRHSIPRLTKAILLALSSTVATSALAEPAAVPFHPDDHRWSAGYGLPGTDGNVLAAVDGSDGLYVTGQFETAGGEVVNYVARWDGVQWHRLSSGLDVYANALAAAGTDIYAGGGFQTAGGIAAQCIAKWDGTAWSALGPGLNGQVYAVDTDGADIYAGGSFNHSGATPVANLAHWDGSQWNDIGGGTNGPVRALLVHGGDLYVGGQFTVVGGASINGIARWDGSSWSQIGDGLEGTVYDIVTDGADIYVANVLVSVYGTLIEGWVKKWDGVGWSIVGQKFDGSTVFDGTITDLCFHEGTLYAGGGINGVDLWQLVGPYWFPISVEGCGVLESFGSRLIVGGSFRDIGNVRAYHIAAFDGSGFHAFDEGDNDGFDGTVYDMVLDGSDLYAGGDFTHIGTDAFRGVARWDGTQWNRLGGGLDFTVRAVAVNDGSVFAGGYWHGGPQQWQAKLKRWDGSSWHDLAGNVSGEVRDIVAWNGDVYVGGRFTSLGGVPLVGIGRWAGGAWHDVGGGVWGDYNDQSVFCLAAGDDALYAGGRFFGAGTESALRIARWDGTQWAPLGEGLVQHPFTIAVDGEKVYVGGVIATAGGNSARGVAMWDGTSWHALGSGVVSTVWSCTVVNHDVYFGGTFADAGGNGIDQLARWDGSDWHPLGSGLRAGYTAAYALANDGEFLYVGGSFEIAGDKASVGFGKWQLDSNPVPVLVQSFVAKAGYGKVALSWSIVDGSEALGSWIARENLRTGKQTIVNELMLPPGTLHFVDDDVVPGASYRYWLEVVLNEGTIRSIPRDVTIAPYVLSLGQNVPNPFNPSTSISFTTTERQAVELVVFDVSGRRIATLVDEVRPPGTHSAKWDGINDAGERVASGVYFVQLRAGNQTLTRKVSLVK